MFPEVTFIPKAPVRFTEIPSNALRGSSGTGEMPWPAPDDTLSVQDDVRLRTTFAAEKSAVDSWLAYDNNAVDLDPRYGHVAMRVNNLYVNRGPERLETSLDVRVTRHNDGSVHAEMAEDRCGTYSNVVDLDPKGQVTALKITAKPGSQGLEWLGMQVSPEGVLSYEAR